ncbi:MOSC domain-containing protein [Sphingomonas radiodurans]|uniref:MOSC domain-containing protein n=1 Tax=Sphingomonas radiodurans TaxID=2890321 RepID=UPI001E3DC1AA|nr:MOSC domain-containing protein [Sphingomonas radiodurans]WBH16433.1 MOSC domain-containing protein [Sphingomonas radiodurans]
MTEPGRLLGIARHVRPKAPIEVIEAAEVTLEGGIAGDYRGGMRRKPYKRQVTLIERTDWEAAMADIGATLAWHERRANLLVDIDLPQVPGARIRIGSDVVLEVTGKDDPCTRMEAIAPGLEAALTPDWRGGVCTKVMQGGQIAVGDPIRIEEPWPSHSARSTTSLTDSPIFAASESSSART